MAFELPQQAGSSSESNFLLLISHCRFVVLHILERSHLYPFGSHILQNGQMRLSFRINPHPTVKQAKSHLSVLQIVCLLCCEHQNNQVLPCSVGHHCRQMQLASILPSSLDRLEAHLLPQKRFEMIVLLMLYSARFYFS